MTQIFGAGKGGEAPSEAPDDLNSRAYARIVEILSEGEIEGFATPSKLGYAKGTTEYSNALMKDVYYNKTRLLRASADDTSPAEGDFNFKNVSLWPRYGTQSQTFVDNNFEAIEDEYSVNIEVKQADPLTRTITDENVDAVRVTINFPSLQEVEDDGAITGDRADVRVEIQYNGGGFQTVVDQRVKGRTRDLYQRDYLIYLGGEFPVDVRVSRMSADSDTVRRENKFIWFSYTEITYQKLTYPNTALVATRLDAEQFSSIPQRSYRIRGIKVKIPTNCTVNPDNGRLIYSGIWDGQFAAAQWTTCPAWILYDLLTSARYGCGDFIKPEMLDKWAFYQASVYSNELVATGRACPECEPRFSCNVNIQSETEVYKLITDLASVFRAMTYWSAGSIAIAQDRPQESTALFTLANVEEGVFTYETSSLKSRATVVAVSWLNLETQDVDVELVEDRDAILKYGVNKKEINAFATTSRSQARRVGEWVLYTDNKETEVVSFRVGMEHGSVLRPGAVVEIADLMKAGVRKAGRVSSATTTTVTVDSPSGLSSETTLAVSLPDGRVEVRSVSSIVGSVITVSPGFSAAPQNGATWMTGLPLLGRTEECDPCTNEEPCGAAAVADTWLNLYYLTGAYPDLDNEQVLAAGILSSGDAVAAGDNTIGTFLDSGVHLTRVAPDGTLVWRLATSGVFSISAVAVKSNDDVVVSTSDDKIQCFSAAGAPQWAVQASGSIALSSYVDGSGNLYALCGAGNVGLPQGVVKYNGSGGVLWRRVVAGRTNISANSCGVDGSGNVFLATWSGSTGSRRTELTKYNSAGVVQWTKEYYVGTDSDLSSVHVDADGSCLLAGRRTAGTNAQRVGYVVKLDASGAVSWGLSISEAVNGRVSASRVVPDGAGGYLLAGFRGQGAAQRAFLISLDSSGNVLWKRFLSGPSYTTFYNLAVRDNWIALAGRVDNAATLSDSSGYDDGILIRLPLNDQVLPTTFRVQGVEGEFDYTWDADTAIATSTAAVTTGTISLTYSSPSDSTSSTTSSLAASETPEVTRYLPL